MASPPFKVKAIYEYISEHDDDLNFPAQQIITVTELEGEDWYVGEYLDGSGVRKDGLFPANFVEKYEPEVPSRPVRIPKSKQETIASPSSATAERSASLDGSSMDAESMPSQHSAPKLPVHEPDVEQPKIATQTPHAVPQGEDQAVASTTSNVPANVRPTPVQGSKPAPPPVVPKSSSFKDRIAAFNKVEQAPIKPFQPGRQAPPGAFIKKPFVAPPPSSSSYVPPIQKSEPVHRPYHREEDPEIRRRMEQDQAAAEAAGLANDPVRAVENEGDDAPKPMSLKERMAMLQEQQRLQAERNAEVAQRKERLIAGKKTPASPSEELDQQMTTTADDDGSSRGDIVEDGQPENGHKRLVSSNLTAEAIAAPPVPDHEILSGGEEADQSAAGELSEGDDDDTIAPKSNDERSQVSADHHDLPEHSAVAPEHEEGGHERQEEGQDEEDEDEEELDEEELRKQRLRERMARLAGPQGGSAMPFNPFGVPMPAPPKKRSTREKVATDDPTSPQTTQERVAIIPVPTASQTEKTGTRDVRVEQSEVPEEYPIREQVALAARSLPQPQSAEVADGGAAPPVPRERPLPPPPSAPAANVARPNLRQTPSQTRSAQIPPIPGVAALASPGPGSESDDEMSTHARISSADMSGVDTTVSVHSLTSPLKREVPPPPTQRPTPSFDPPQDAAPQDAAPQDAAHGSEAISPTLERRASRVPPPIPGNPSIISRAPPPPPPNAPPVPAAARTMTEERPVGQRGDVAGDESGESDYEGDYDTDIASGEKHKDALKAHGRAPSLDESITTEQTDPPRPSAQRSAPPLPPSNATRPRASMEQQRLPPPIPNSPAPEEDEYDPYRYTSLSRPQATDGPVMPQRLATVEPEESSADETAPSKEATLPPRIADRPPPPPPPTVPPQSTQTEDVPIRMPAVANEPPSRQSLSVQRGLSAGRRSIDQGRPSSDLGQMASDIDLNLDVPWWTAQNPLPPILQPRSGIDLLSESEESVTSKRGGRTTIVKDIYILFMDYSQTVITVRYDTRDAAEVNAEQRHEAPPSKLRQDQLEAYWHQFGSKIGQAARSAASSKKDTFIGDGAPSSLPLELIKTHPQALLPVGTRAYGALVYANLANASTMQFDEIRSGDILTLRNARFEGHHGAIKQKYKQDYGPSHVVIVDEWDGTKRSVRGWEQGREKKGALRNEKFRLGDLRSGEIRVWRVVGRDWVGWESST